MKFGGLAKLTILLSLEGFLKREFDILIAILKIHAVRHLESPENKRQIDMAVRHDRQPYICLLFSGFSNVYHFACVWPTALKLGCVTNLDTFFLVMGFISLVDEI